MLRARGVVSVSAVLSFAVALMLTVLLLVRASPSPSRRSSASAGNNPLIQAAAGSAPSETRADAAKPFVLPPLNLTPSPPRERREKCRTEETAAATSVTPPEYDYYESSSDEPLVADKIVDIGIDSAKINSLIQNLLKRRRTRRRDGNSGQIKEEEDKQRNKFKKSSLSLNVFKSYLDHIHSYHDIFKRFYDMSLTEKEIDYRLYGRHRQDTLNKRRAALNEVSKHVHMVQEHIHTPGLDHPVAELVNIPSSDPSLEYIPSYTILHRCPQHSCCPMSVTNGVCEAASQTEVELPFVSVKKLPSGSVTLDPQSSDLVVRMTFANHTSCRCAAAAAAATCPRCPEPFVRRSGGPGHGPGHHLSGGGGGCTCECYSEDSACTDIRDGFRQMPADSHSCIESGECAVPTCYYGEYDRRDHQCPLSEYDYYNEDTSYTDEFLP